MMEKVVVTKRCISTRMLRNKFRVLPQKSEGKQENSFPQQRAIGYIYFQTAPKMETNMTTTT